MAQTTAQLIHQNSGKTKYYTPAYILEAAAKVMGDHYGELGKKYRFELDPASDGMGNEYVHAERYLDEQLDGLNHSWTARSVWLNHPYGRSTNKAWVNKAVKEYLAGHAKQLCMIVWASTSEKWFHPLFKFPICFIAHRVKFTDPLRTLKSGATKSSAVIYMGPHLERFVRTFDVFGYVMVPPTRQMIDPTMMQGLTKIHQLAASLLGHGQNGRIP